MSLPTAVVRARYRKAAVGVENIAEAEVTITRITDARVMEGYIDSVTDDGQRLRVEL